MQGHGYRAARCAKRVCRRQRASWTRWIPFTAVFRPTVRSTNTCVANCVSGLRRKLADGSRRTCRLVAQLRPAWRLLAALVVHARRESQRFVIVPATEPKWRFDDDQDRALLLRLAACGGDRRAGVCGGVSLHGVPTAYWRALWRRHHFPERAGAHRGAEQDLCARQRRGAKDRNSFLP